MGVINRSARIVTKPRVIDLAIVLGILAVSLPGAMLSPLTADRLPGHVVLLLLQILPLLVRRTFPVPTLVATGAALLADLALYPVGAATLGPLVAVYTVGAQVPRGRALAAVATFLAGFVAVAATSNESLLRSPILIANNVTIVVVAWLLGESSRLRGVLARTAAERDSLLERERAEDRARTIREERERIARELHDVVTHHVAVIAIQAAVANQGQPSHQGEVESPVALIRRSARLALDDMRRMVRVLGATTDSDGDLPLPGLDDLRTLVGHVRDAGVQAELVVAGAAHKLDEGIELVAYRIVQEALTNAMRHASGASVRVTVTYLPQLLALEVVDDGRGSPLQLEPPHEGRGLSGMRQRVELFHGRLECGRRPRGGFRVWAELPIADPSTGSPA